MSISRIHVALLAAAIVAAAGRPLAAQQPLAEARALYAAAAYEDALSALAALDPAGADRAEAEQYRAFCLIALGRTVDAERAIEHVVSADPLFVPGSADVPPRIQAMFTDVRRRILPEIARRAYLDGRRSYQAKDYVNATRQFDQVMRVIDQAGVEGAEGMDDLRILVAGFVDLAKAATAPVSEPVRDPEPPASRVAGQAAQAPGGAGSGYTAPVAVRQDLPRWTPPNPSIGARAYEGAVKVSIGADGHVQDVSMVAPVHPMYDPLVLQAARRWVYRPATRLGEPAPSEKVVEIRLAPR